MHACKNPCPAPLHDPSPSPSPTRYPSRDKQALFFAHYFSSDGAPAQLAPRQLDRLCAEADLFALASHIYWGVWAVVQARYSPIDFDYLDYHQLRLAEYHRRKGEVIARAAAVFAANGGAPACCAAKAAAPRELAAV